jgi:PPOX class probable F420-dependent enzyme
MNGLDTASRTILERPGYAHLATLLPDGSPHTVPVWAGIEGEHIAVLTSPTSRKARNIAADPRVAISITDPENPHSMAMIRGRVVETIDGDRGWQIIDRISESYIGAPYPLRTDRVVFLLAPEHVTSAAFG